MNNLAVNRPICALIVALLALALAGCATMEVGIERTATPAPIAATATQAATTAPQPQATAAPRATTAPPLAEPTAAPTGLVSQVKVFLIALDDGGKNGLPVGCGDSVIPVERQVEPTNEPLEAAYRELLSIRGQFYGQSGLYNALYQCELQVDSVTLVDGLATVRLSGTTALGGVCDDPRVEAQLRETALQFATVKDVAVYVNGQTMQEWLSLK
ncbi:MAG TPA: GerMN domain-containing protein [Anaerolineae bacterium]|nr:GerMN domain-containing protein [Anaerolineae bacterium]HOQ99436.1 GerMN domain-containing protein [Anaerolineae bacterium]HPL27741.1 GerMN domain-containing protein [Anaerolineae bacterium]